MKEKISLRRWITNFNNGLYDKEFEKTQIEGPLYDSILFEPLDRSVNKKGSFYVSFEYPSGIDYLFTISTERVNFNIECFCDSISQLMYNINYLADNLYYIPFRFIR